MSNAKTAELSIGSVPKIKETSRAELEHPVTGEVLVDGDGNALWIETYGQYSKHYKAVNHDIVNRNIDRASKSKKNRMSAEQLDAVGTERVIRCIENWYLVDSSNKEIKFSEKEARKQFEENPWLYDQAEASIYDLANYLGK